jgi:hypothetical protein
MPERDRPVVAMYPAGAHAAHARLLDALGDACAVRIVAGDSHGGSCQAEIVVGAATYSERYGRRSPFRPTLAIAEPGATDSIDVRLERSPYIDPKLHGIDLPGQQIATAAALDPGDEVLAVSDAGPVWTRARARPVVQLRAAFPQLADDEVLRATLGSDRTHRMLAVIGIVAFLREVADDPWEQPPLRASFVFDDPNLRLMRYGHIDYRALWDEAARHEYHVGMAMVPLDAGHPSSDAVEFFNHHREQLSLAIHGNDHVRAELLRAQSFNHARSLAAQALERIARFERRTDLHVGRVMMPPHGMCSREMVAALAELGYDGICALHPTPWTEKAPVERPLAGWTPATFVDGCAVVPRVPLHASSAELAIRAYLGQPLVLYGHHGDVANGYDVLTDAAARVNRLGNVEWLSLSRLVRSNYQTRVIDGMAHVRPWGTHLDVALPAEAEAVSVELAPHADAARFGVTGVSIGDTPAVRHELGQRVAVDGSTRVAVRLLPAHTLDPRLVRRPIRRPRAWARRRVAELRDQITPAARRASHVIATRR